MFAKAQSNKLLEHNITIFTIVLTIISYYILYGNISIETLPFSSISFFKAIKINYDIYRIKPSESTYISYTNS